MAARPLSSHSALQLEVLFSQKGMHERSFQHVYQDPTLSGSANTYHAAFQYLDAPLLYTWGPGRYDQTGLFVALGPQISFAYSKREYVYPTSEGPDGPNEETLNTNYSSLAPVTAGYVVGRATGGPLARRRACVWSCATAVILRRCTVRATGRVAYAEGAAISFAMA